MIDALLGRASLKEEIAALEDQVASLQEDKENLAAQLESAEERRKEAVRDHQAAAEEVNKLEDRIAQLTDKIERLEAHEDEDITARRREELGREGTAEVLDRLQSVSAPPEGAFSAVIEDTVPEAARSAFGDRAVLLDRHAPCIGLTTHRNLLSVALQPPLLPATTHGWDDSFDLDRSWFLPTGTFTIALVRADTFAMGTYQGDEQLAVRGFTSDVMDEHSKGGFSQDRFERRREHQIDEHLTACEETIKEEDPDRLYLVGDAEAIDALPVEADATAPVDATGKPEAALEQAFDQFFRTTLLVL